MALTLQYLVKFAACICIVDVGTPGTSYESMVKEGLIHARLRNGGPGIGRLKSQKRLVAAIRW